MPKMKTNRTAYKKFKVSASGRVKRAQACTSHNTAKKSPARLRRLRKTVGVDDTNMYTLEKLLPFRAQR